MAAGDADRVIPFAHSERIAAELPHATLVRFPGVGHLPMLEQPDVMDEALADLLRRSAARARGTPARPAGDPTTDARAGRPARTLPLDTELELPAAADTEALGERLARGLGAGDLVVLAGPLGAGKTVMVRGLARGLGVAGPITSPTFVIAREHRPLPGGAGVPLVHVDAYRLGGAGADVAAELDDLDLDTDLDGAVVAVEWGEGVAERLSARHLLVRLDRRPDDVRVATVHRVGRPDRPTGPDRPHRASGPGRRSGPDPPSRGHPVRRRPTNSRARPGPIAPPPSSSSCSSQPGGQTAAGQRPPRRPPDQPAQPVHRVLADPLALADQLVEQLGGLPVGQQAFAQQSPARRPAATAARPGPASRSRPAACAARPPGRWPGPAGRCRAGSRTSAHITCGSSTGHRQRCTEHQFGMSQRSTW